MNAQNGRSADRGTAAVLRGCIAVAWLVASACGAPALVKLPSGPATPATDAREAIAQAMSACERVDSLTAEIAVSGSVSGQRVRGRMIAGVAKPASARLEAVAPFGAPLFVFAARGTEATLLLPRDDRVVEHGRPAEVLEAATGVPLDPQALRATLTACAVDPSAEGARAIGDGWRIVHDGDGEVYLRRSPPAAPWRIVATVRPDWRADYADFQNALPRAIRLSGADRRRFDLRLALSQVEVNPALGVDAFTVNVPRSATPITLDELRHSRPGVREN